MDPVAAKYIGAGIACIGMGGAGAGVGIIFGNYLAAALRNPSALARGFRLSTELVAGVLVGAFIGWALDKWLGISPWGMIVFLLLGFAAGVVNVMRAAGVSPGPGR